MMLTLGSGNHNHYGHSLFGNYVGFERGVDVDDTDIAPVLRN